ncbi:LpxI family protein [Rhizobium halophytocola]|uniref:DUF1009 family protein n=1 Tax=Rhizobium halophytocola TaxID=735519 RepID=A0ABS4DW73_9HYPH|nr:LpxI family protein [Rhizobium halophytocola]MBP1849953.1 DUF1009 family protein [Rhizobium halophytocola]
MPEAAAASSGRLAIIAGEGRLPHYVAQAARDSGENPLILTLKNEAGGDWSGFDAATIGVGDMAGLARLIKRHGIGRVVMSGGVKRRPDFKDIHVNLKTIAKLPSTIRTLLSGGDDAVLKMVISLIEAQGCQVVGAQDIAPNLLANLGPVGRHAPDDAARRDIARAGEAAELLGRLDVGQGAVSVGGRVVALEGVEGTDAMLERVAALRQAGRISAKRRGVIVKLCKPQQDIRADLPSIGRSTVENAARAGLAGIAVEAGRALVIEREAVCALADDLGLFVCGIDRSLAEDGL